jgi:hypothetical protein
VAHYGGAIRSRKPVESIPRENDDGAKGDDDDEVHDDDDHPREGPHEIATACYPARGGRTSSIVERDDLLTQAARLRDQA